MRKPPTGEPYAGKPPVRFGGREGNLPDPYRKLNERTGCALSHDRVCSAFQLGVALQPGDDFDDDSIAFFSCPSQLLLAASNLFASWSSFIARFLCLSGSAIFVMPASMLAIEALSHLIM